MSQALFSCNVVLLSALIYRDRSLVKIGGQYLGALHIIVFTVLAYRRGVVVLEKNIFSFFFLSIYREVKGYWFIKR